METEEEWNLMNDAIQRRNTKSFENKWSIGLTKEKKRWELDLGAWKTADYLQMGTRGAEW